MLHVQGFLETRLKKCKNRINRPTCNDFLLSAPIDLSAVGQCFPVKIKIVKYICQEQEQEHGRRRRLVKDRVKLSTVLRCTRT